jgi:hypothetical protein
MLFKQILQVVKPFGFILNYYGFEQGCFVLAVKVLKAPKYAIKYTTIFD